MFSCCASPASNEAEVRFVDAQDPKEEPAPAPEPEEPKPEPIPEPEEPKPEPEEPKPEPILEREEPKPEPKSEPIPEPEEPPPYQEWNVKISKPAKGGKLGITLGQDNPECCLVKEVKDVGLISEWNTKSPESAIKPGDAIIEANGKTGEKTIMSTIKQDSDLNLKIRRAENFVVKLEKKRGQANFKIGISLHGSSVAEISKVMPEGAIEEHNKKCEPGFMVVIGDQILEVNGVGGTCAEITQAIREAAGSEATGKVELKIRRK